MRVFWPCASMATRTGIGSTAMRCDVSTSRFFPQICPGSRTKPMDKYGSAKSCATLLRTIGSPKFPTRARSDGWCSNGLLAVSHSTRATAKRRSVRSSNAITPTSQPCAASWLAIGCWNGTRESTGEPQNQTGRRSSPSTSWAFFGGPEFKLFVKSADSISECADGEFSLRLIQFYERVTAYGQNRRARRRRRYRSLQGRRNHAPSGPVRRQGPRDDDSQRPRVHHPAYLANSLAESGRDRHLLAYPRIADRPHPPCRCRGPHPDSTRHRRPDCQSSRRYCRRHRNNRAAGHSGEGRFRTRDER